MNVCYLIPGHLSYSDTPKEEGEVRMEQDSWPWHSSCRRLSRSYREAVSGRYDSPRQFWELLWLCRRDPRKKCRSWAACWWEGRPGKINFQFIESSSFNLNALINLAAETHFDLCTNTIINNGLNWIRPSKVKVVKESVSSQYQYFQMIADL